MEDKMTNEELSMEELRAIMLSMMEEFDTFCNDHGLHYYLAYGTLIGALRHKGFIPWDDDMDLIMPRCDYDQLLAFDKISETTKIVSHVHQNGCRHPFCYANLIDCNTHMISANMGESSGKGVFIDIFPLDALPENHVLRKIYLEIMCLLTKLIYWTFPVNQDRMIKRVVGKRMKPERWTDLVDRLSKKYNTTNSNHLSVTVSVVYKDDFGGMDNFEPFRMTEFEGMILRIPKKAENILEITYGDWRKLPPESERVPHHSTRFFKRDKN